MDAGLCAYTDLKAKRRDGMRILRMGSFGPTTELLQLALLCIKGPSDLAAILQIFLQLILRVGTMSSRLLAPLPEFPVKLAI